MNIWLGDFDRILSKLNIFYQKFKKYIVINDKIDYDGNNRDIQDIGDRKLYLTGHPCNPPEEPNEGWGTWFTHKLNIIIIWYQNKY